MISLNSVPNVFLMFLLDYCWGAIRAEFSKRIGLVISGNVVSQVSFQAFHYEGHHLQISEDLQ